MSQSITTPLQVVKRDGRAVDFDTTRIERAVIRCMNEGTNTEAHNREIAQQVVDMVDQHLAFTSVDEATVEHIQDLVEQSLMYLGEHAAAKRYILYREVHQQQRAERPIPDDVVAAFAADDQYFPSPLQRFQFVDKYARFNPALGRRESWVETVDRTVDYLHELASPRADLGAETYERIRRGILEMRVMPSMRLLAMAGPAARRNNAALFNCTFEAVHSLEAFPEALILSMSGCGVGFSVEAKHVDRLPTVVPGTPSSVLRHLIDDSTEGWAEALTVGLHAWFGGQDVDFDYSQIRPAGTVLATKGGRASGPEPLRQMLRFVSDRIRSRAGKRLRPIDAHDIMCAVGNAAVSGGVRRTAMISLFDEDDAEMLHAKDPGFDRDNPQRWNANNSMVWTDTATMDQAVFVDRFMAMVRGGNGEPGIFSREAARRMLPARRDPGHAFGVNPCLAVGTLVQTRGGHFPVEQLVGKSVEIWNGSDWQVVDNFRVTGENQSMLKITLQDGSEVRVTRYHTMILADGSKVEAKDLVAGQKLQISEAPKSHGNVDVPGSYLKGFLVADGSQMDMTYPILHLYEPKWGCRERLIESAKEIAPGDLHTSGIAEPAFVRDSQPNRMRMQGLSSRKAELIDWAHEFKYYLPKSIFSWSRRSKLEFIAGVMDADGCAIDTKCGFGYQITSINRSWLLDFQALLKSVGVHSKLALMRKAGAMDFGDGYGSYDTKDCWRLSIGQRSALLLAGQAIFSRLTGFSDKVSVYNVKPRFNQVEKIELDGVDGLVYCCTVEGSGSFALTNGIQVGNCGEIVLRDMQMCNLSSAIVRAGDTYTDLVDKVSLATLIGTIQSLATTFPGLRPDWKRNCEEERLLGVSLDGQQDNPTVLTPESMRILRAVAVTANTDYAGYLGINRSAAITCVKPSGNSSQLLDAASGLHARWSPYYVRNVRVSATSPVARLLRDAGVPMSPENGDDPVDPRTWVASFPVAAPVGAVTRNDRSAVEQCEWWLKNKLHWTEHNPSVTITYRPDEVLALMTWVWEHRDVLGGMAFLPSFDAKYDQLPYIEVDRAEYERRAAAFPTIDWSKIYRHETSDLSTASTTLACEGDICLLSDGGR